MKAPIKNYMTLTKRDWNGITVLLLLIALTLAIPYVYQWMRKDNTISSKELDKAMAGIIPANQPIYDINDKGNKQRVALFKFDPNTLTADKWHQLGLTGQQVNTMINYRAKGGRFYRPEDLKKVYGITPADYIRLEPFIHIFESPSDQVKAANRIVEINTADSARLTAIPGVGPAFAMRIIYYRERLGGFTAKEQLREVYGLDEIKFKEIKNYVKVNGAHIRKININTINFDKLRLMPYLNYKQVNALIAYRGEHGNYNSINDIKQVAIIDDGVLKKIEPYLVFK